MNIVTMSASLLGMNDLRTARAVGPDSGSMIVMIFDDYVVGVDVRATMRAVSKKSVSRVHD